ncbi:MAG: FHA domain-containing protein [Kofleriaceae bacterium]|nr:FHA domain-containing protein [Kofleriaceae bacterium]
MKTITRNDGGWAISDRVLGLRTWGSRDAFALPESADRITIGSAEGCAIRLQDAQGTVSRQHAALERSGGVWTIRDLESKNGTYLDGERRSEFTLTPGVEIELGRAKLIAESARLVELRAFMERIIGWEDARRADVDRALRSIRDTASRGTVLVLCGAGDLAPTARRIHELAFGAARPFVAAAKTVEDPAAGGTLFLSTAARPRDIVTAQASTWRVVLGAPARADAADLLAHLERTVVIDLPAIATRQGERERLIAAYAQDAVRALGAPHTGFKDHDPHWLADIELASLEAIEELARRLVAVRNWGVTHGAKKLEISQQALAGWLRRRKIPT